uniref:ATP-dependent RNA helicase n=1 Tax=Loa loa TaxID=7209 RepID=A0A1I7V8R6_LOALO
MIRILEDLEGSRSRVMSILIQITYIYGYNTFSSKTGMEVDEKEGESGTSVSDDERPGTSIPDDEMSETEESENHIYEVLGHDTFVNLKKIESCAELDSVEGLHPLLAHRIREHLKKWYPVQRTVLPYLVAASSICSIFPPRDLVISSPTGSGKTLCYVIPILNALRGCTMMGYLFALIVAPVQNLVDQIEKEFKKYNVFNVRIASLCGSHDLNVERQHLESANIAIATPGRLMEHITDLDFPVDFTHLRYLVVDEADRMSHTARIEWLNDLEVVANYSHNCVTIDDLYNASFLQKILLSATLSLDVEDLHEWRLRHPRLFKAVKEDVIVTNELSLSSVIIPTSLKIEYIICDTKFKPLATYERIEGRKSWKKILIFVNSKMASYRLTILLKMLSAGKYQVEELSSNLFGNRRQKVLARFRKGTTRVLISSDVLSRGIDVEDIDVVINYDKPLNERLFVHRIGRTARCGKKGKAVFLISTKEVKKDFQTTLQKISFTGKIKERNFEGAKDAETEELYKQALTKLKEALQNTQKGTIRKNGIFKNRRKKVAKL